MRKSMRRDRCPWARSRLFSPLCATVVMIVGVLCVSPAGALDASRSLTQSLHRIWQIPQGLPQPTIFALRQTGDGYLWLGTPDGLIRFDGIRFVTIANFDGVAAAELWVNDLCDDRDGNLWIASDGQGLIRYNRAGTVRYTTSDGLPSNTVYALTVDRDGRVWAGTAAGLARLGDKITPLGAAQGLPLDEVRAVAAAPDGKIWTGGNGPKLGVWNGNDFDTVELTSLPVEESVRALLVSADGTVWVGTSVGLVKIVGDQQTWLSAADGLPDDSILTLAAASDGSVWVGTKEGFSRVRGSDIQSFGGTDGLSQSTVYAMCEDHEGSLWVGTKHGLNQFSDRRSVPFTVREGLPSNNVGPLAQDAAGSIWVGTLGGGLAQYDGRGFTTRTTADGLASNTVFSLVADDQGNLWAGTDRGLNRLIDGRTKRTYTTADGLPSDTVSCLCFDGAGRLWAGTSAGLVRLEGERFVAPASDAHALRLSITSLIKRRDGAVLAAAKDEGLFVCVHDDLRPLAIPGMAQRNVDTIYEDHDGRLWLGSQGQGLLLLEGDKFVPFTMRNGLADDDVTGIAVDDQDRMWMASSNGLAHLPRADLLKFAAGDIKTLTSTAMRLTDSLRTFESQEGVQPGFVRMRDGTLWLSTTRGLIVLDPGKLVRVLPPTPVVIERVVVNGQDRNPVKIDRLSPGAKNLAFEYTALSLLVPVRITFRYMLEGFDKDWVDAGTRREAFYTNLEPGNYRFRVAARNVDETFWEASRPVSFTIEPYFYQTRWFPPLCALILGACGWGAYRLRVRHIKEQMRAVVAERSRIARELHDTLMQGFSGVTMEMQALATRLSPSNERGTLEEIIHDAANCLRDARRSVAGLRNPAGQQSGLAASIAQAAQQLTETRDFRLKLSLDSHTPQLPPDVQYNLLRIAQEAVANAVKHSGARAIEVRLACTPRELTLMVQDDGTGFDTLDHTAVGTGHYGLIGMKERAAQIGGTFHIESGLGSGTAILVTLPILDRYESTPQRALARESEPQSAE